MIIEKTKTMFIPAAILNLSYTIPITHGENIPPIPPVIIINGIKKLPDFGKKCTQRDTINGHTPAIISPVKINSIIIKTLLLSTVLSLNVIIINVEIVRSK